uniref:Uncharacterized protein n=1 Tax=Rhizophora mucronata TaxID=61149 RepID=A0A2P2P437_RHIMU
MTLYKNHSNLTIWLLQYLQAKFLHIHNLLVQFSFLFCFFTFCNFNRI